MFIETANVYIKMRTIHLFYCQITLHKCEISYTIYLTSNFVPLPLWGLLRVFYLELFLFVKMYVR